nr:zinc finger, AN1-type, zinc finger, A20-type [Tanacetum cinerariifolium]
MPSMKEELNQSTTPPLCKTGCGFYVNKETGGFYSNYYKADVLKKKSSSEVPKIPDVTSNVDNQKPVENHHQSNEVVKKRNRFHVCSKRVGLVPFLCRCGESFCGLHRMPEKHACKFDFKAVGRVVIEKQNPLCVADKLEFRRFIDDGICVLDGSPTKWLNLIPIKINILAWRVALNKLPTRFNMSLRGMEVSTMKFPVCHVGNETSDHLFFSCSLVSAMISRLFKWWELSNMVFQSYHGWENWLNNNVDNQRPVENHHQSNKVVKKKNRCHACEKRVSPSENKVFVSWNAKFFKSKHLDLKASMSVEDLKLISEEDTNHSIDTSLNHEEDDQEINEPQSDMNPIRRSTRTCRPIDRLCLYIDVEEYELGDLGELANYKAALLDPESKKWLDAMNVEMQSMIDNDVWVLAELPPNARTVGSKWLFKKKTDIDGAVYVFKARLVAKGFTQTYRVDYEETFSCVADIRDIRILIAIATYYDYEIWKMDVKTAFLNGHLSEEVYMEQPEGFVNLKYPNHNDPNARKAYIKSQGASTPAEKQPMQNIPYASAIRSIIDVVRCTRPHIAFTQNMTSRFQQNLGEEHWTTVKNILKYLRNTKDMFMVYGGNIERELRVSCYTDAGYLTDVDNLKSQTGYVLCIVLTIEEPISIYCENTKAIEIPKDDGVTKGARHFRAKVYYLYETIKLVDVKIEKIDTYDNSADPFAKALAFLKHSELTRNIKLLPASSFM